MTRLVLVADDSPAAGMRACTEWLWWTMSNMTHPRTNRGLRQMPRTSVRPVPPTASRVAAPARQAGGHGGQAGADLTGSVLLRKEIGEVLRSVRQHQGRTLREVSSQARVSLGYLSEVERGQKEASSELLASICQALDAPLSAVLREVSDRVAVIEGLAVPDTVPDELVRQQGVATR